MAHRHSGKKMVTRSRETVWRLIRSSRLGTRWAGTGGPIKTKNLRGVEDDAHPMAALPDEWSIGDDGEPALNWVAAVHRSRSGRESAPRRPRRRAERAG